MDITKLSKKAIKDIFKSNGHALAYALDEMNLVETMKTQTAKPSKNNPKPSVHTVRVYAEISQAIKARKKCKKTKQGKLASALLETILELKSEFGSSRSAYFSMVATGNSRQITFYVDAPQAIKDVRKVAKKATSKKAA